MGSLDEHRQSAPYRQTRTIRVDAAAGKILGFAPLADGRLAVLSGRADASESETGEKPLPPVLGEGAF